MTFSALDSELLGPLFTTAAMRACFTDEARVAAMLAAEAALARAEAGLVAEGLAAAIEAIPARELDWAALGQRTAVAGVPTIPFLDAVRARLPAGSERGFHMGATTQDILDTALVLQLRPALALIAADLDALLGGLTRLAETHRTTLCVGRTYGQHAAPLTFGYKAAVWLTGIADVADRLPDVRDRLLVASLGGPVGTLAGLGDQGPAVLQAFARELNLGLTPLAWHSLRGRMVEAGCWLATLMGALAKMAVDVAHMASTEVGEVSEPHMPGRGGSSAMPHKRNPVSCTVILAAQAAAKGHVATLFDAMAAAHERPTGLWHAEWHALPPLFGLVSGALHEARTLACGLVVDTVRMRANLDMTRGLLFADAAAARLGVRLGREAAHKLVEQAADMVRQTGGDLRTAIEAITDTKGADLAPAFDFAPTLAVASPWIDRAVQHAGAISQRLARRGRVRSPGI